jgi:hypothetical protein
VFPCICCELEVRATLMAWGWVRYEFKKDDALKGIAGSTATASERGRYRGAVAVVQRMWFFWRRDMA